MSEKEPREKIMIYQSQHSLLGGRRLEGGSDKERSRMVKGSEMKLIKKRKQTLNIFFPTFLPTPLPHTRHFGRNERKCTFLKAQLCAGFLGQV